MQEFYIQSDEVSIIDASVIEARQCRPNKRKDSSSTQDPEAAWNVKAGSDGKRKNTYIVKVSIEGPEYDPSQDRVNLTGLPE